MTSIRYGLVFSLCLAIAATCVARDDAVARKAAPVGGTGMSASKSLVDNFAAAKDLKTFSDALKSGGLTDTLEGPGPFTVFAPTDAAFKKLPEGTVVNLKADENKPQLVAVLTYHIVPGGFSTKDLAEKIKDGGGKAELKTIQGEKLTVQMKGKTIEIVDGKGDTAHVTVPNVAQANGIVHVIDAVLLP